MVLKTWMEFQQIRSGWRKKGNSRKWRRLASLIQAFWLRLLVVLCCSTFRTLQVKTPDGVLFQWV